MWRDRKKVTEKLLTYIWPYNLWDNAPADNNTTHAYERDKKQKYDCSLRCDLMFIVFHICLCIECSVHCIDSAAVKQLGIMYGGEPFELFFVRNSCAFFLLLHFSARRSCHFDVRASIEMDNIEKLGTTIDFRLGNLKLITNVTVRVLASMETRRRNVFGEYLINANWENAQNYVLTTINWFFVCAIVRLIDQLASSLEVDALMGSQRDFNHHVRIDIYRITWLDFVCLLIVEKRNLLRIYRIYLIILP